MIPRETFKYTDDGSVGLMTDDYKALFTGKCGIYTNEDCYTPLEFSYHYLREMFKEVMGFDEFYIAVHKVHPFYLKKILSKMQLKISIKSLTHFIHNISMTI